jgi:uncharacterized protein with GYD domain
MARYLWQVSYTADGVKGVLGEGGTGRRQAVETLVKGIGGRLESFDFAFGADDVIVIAELPDNVTAAAVGLTVAAAGAATIRTTVLISPDEIDAAAKKTIDYRAPGA